MRCPHCKYNQSPTNTACTSCGLVFTRLTEAPLIEPAAPRGRGYWMRLILPSVLFMGLILFIGTKVNLRGSSRQNSSGARRAIKPKAMLDKLCERSAAEQGATEATIQSLCYGDETARASHRAEEGSSRP